MDRSRGERDSTPGRVVPIIDADRVAALIEALALRESGGIPLLGDDRWDARLWAGLRRLADDAEPVPGMAWATFSSGSTGAPRVILRTESSWSASFPGVSGLFELTDADVVYLPAPLASSLSLFSVAHARSLGAGIILPQAHTISPADLECATVMHGTPNALAAAVEVIEGGASHRLRAALVGGAHLDSALRERAEAAGIRVVSYYGAAELSFVAVDADGLGYRPFPGVEVRVDEGDLWVRSPYFAAGYLGGASGSMTATTGALRRDGQGWATVGDVVDADSAGLLRLRGRRDGAILTAAATVIPEDVEAALRAIDAVEDAIVFGVPNAGTGSLVAALVETTAGNPIPSARELREQARTRLALSHLPRRWFWTENLPRTATGKPARAAARDAVLAGSVRRLD
ncbi:long-chain fatty acid--CoA ligase [Lacisediminihabitans profunda]|uniref:Long-chain fatty acid--CoA ligase n=1 Tax=Lacisediminihabitans profunda TaxID=2594790 RepID=A0A5C8UV33_9MICO|nr:long-chain fatty acid--CoA ligase [Lacisediminihabitans profunda]